jgi:hypothetical protein
MLRPVPDNGLRLGTDTVRGEQGVVRAAALVRWLPKCLGTVMSRSVERKALIRRSWPWRAARGGM